MNQVLLSAGQAPTITSASPCVWNRAKALANADHDLQLLLDLTEIWHRQSQELLDDICREATRGNVPALLELAHKLKGSLQVLAAEPALAAANVLADAARQQELAILPAAFDDLARALRDLQSEIDAWKSRQAVDSGLESPRTEGAAE